LTVITVAIIVAATLSLAFAFASYYLSLSSSVAERVELVDYLGDLSFNLYYYVEWRIDNVTANSTRLYIGALNYNPSPLLTYILVLEAHFMNSTLTASVNGADPPQPVDLVLVQSSLVYVLGPDGYAPLDAMLGEAIVPLHAWLLDANALKPYLARVDVEWGAARSAFILFLVNVGGEYYEVARLSVHR
jgi:hypothetical protein